LMVNPALERLTSMSFADLEQRSLYDLLEGGWSGSDAVAIGRTIQALIDTAGKQDTTWDTRHPSLTHLVTADRQRLQAEIHLSALATGDPAAGDILVQGVVHDVTARERTRREFDALRQTASAVIAADSVDNAVLEILRTLEDQPAYESATFWMMHANGVELIDRFADPERPATVAIGDGPAGRAATTADTVFVRGAHGQLSVVGQSNQSRICVPVFSNGQVSGIVDVTGVQGQPLDDQDVTFLKSMTTSLASAFARIQLHQELRRQAMIDTVTGLENRETFLKRLEAVIEAASSEPVSLLIVGVDRFKAINDTYGHLVADELLKQVAETLKIRVRPPLTIARYTSDQFAIIVPDVGRDNAPAIAENFRIGVATQLFMAAEQVEQMTVSVGAATYPNDADSLDQLLLAASHAMYLAKQAGRNQVYQSNEAFAELAVAHGRITDLLRQSPRETLALLVRAMDQRTPERAGHSQRVADYALALARTLGMREEDFAALRIAAVIHDIGMFSLPDSLLRKPSGLSDSEREMLYSIPINAHRLLSQIPLPESVLPSVVHQHEHWDGSGYPSGLKGDMIPPGARIIAVADAIDAMTSERAHRQSLSMEEALQALAEQAGSRFDPDVVRAARSLLGELDDVSQGRAGRNLESTLVEALAVIPPVERASA
jgi:diguanylate cyclase (GGDEF)-like protein